ncbi:phospholipid-translocating P-type ATPase [Schizophyllum commune Tattone D]|nr:phospholipid-translocating P-type ATPase [Schizophyllum commune Tattone D]
MSKQSMNTLAKWSARFSIERLFSPKQRHVGPRTVFVHEELPKDYYDHRGHVLKDHVYHPNQIISSKYTLFTFLPRNLLEQFRRIANIFFLGIAIIQFFPEFHTISPGVAILPLIIIIVVTGIKDGYEDYKRHVSDRNVNQSKVDVIAGDGWHNPNAMKGKQKTFVRRLIPKQLPGVKHRDMEGGKVVPDSHAPHWKTELWEDLRVGDFVKITDGEAIPADILICSTSEDANVAFVETKNLDGETNLKSRSAVPALTHIRTPEDCVNPENKFSVDCDRPDMNMYRINAAVSVAGMKSSVDLVNVLLRGTILRNTKWVVGVVLFTGVDTKIVLNGGLTPSKRTKIERQMNGQVLLNLALLAIMTVVCGIVDSVLEQKYYPLGAPWLYGDNQDDDNPSINGLITWAFSLLTFQIIIPISLYISLEVVRTLQAASIYFDDDLKYQKTGQRTVARSWNLADDLGQIEYIFSDKTGTLTQNVMVFRQCSIGGRSYTGDEEAEAEEVIVAKQSSSSEALPKFKTAIPHFKDAALQADLDAAFSEKSDPADAAHARLLNGFLSCLALCHTVLASHDTETDQIEYKAQSPDEAALVQAAADIGYIFLGQDKEVLTLQTPSSIERYELLNVLEFTSARKRMSVVLRKLDDEDGRLFLFTKGADNVIFERLRAGSDDLKAATEEHLSEFARHGLRTLTLAYKVIREEDYVAWSDRYHEASVAMDEREEKIEAVCEELETDLRLLGATAVEDRLQDEVPETIADLKRGGIKIWVATGDKLETAIAIGRSTNLIGEDSNIIVVRGGNPSGRPVRQQMHAAIETFFPEHVNQDEQLELEKTGAPPSPGGNQLRRVNTGVSSIVGPENGDRPGGFVLVIDGAALHDAFDDDENRATLLRLAILCEGVICCRVSPKQKAQIVHLVKDGLRVMCLAIGDGANDVSMIQAADIGVGISGEEGRQAVNSSDYAIAQFRFLKKLLLVHGHWSYARISKMILTFFYKNIVPVGVLWWFQIYSAWSGYYVFDYIYVLFYNSIWTVLSCPAIGLFDRIAHDRDLMDLPELYKYGRLGTWFAYRNFFIYMIDGVYQSVIVFFFILYAYRTDSARGDGYDTGMYEMSTTMIMAIVLIANLYIGFAAHAWTWWLLFGTQVGTLIVWVYTAIYSSLDPASTGAVNLAGNDFYLFHSPIFWFCLVITFCLSFAPRYLARAYNTGFGKLDDLDMVNIIRKRDPHRSLKIGPASDEQDSTDIEMARLKRRQSRPMSVMSGVSSVSRVSRPATAMASRTDMSTGIVSVDRGFDFATEEPGPAMRRIQTNLSERRTASRLALHETDERHPHHKASLKNGLSHLARGLTRKKGSH